MNDSMDFCLYGYLHIIFQQNIQVSVPPHPYVGSAPVQGHTIGAEITGMDPKGTSLFSDIDNRNTKKGVIK
jgi:hypothetical protein